MGARDTLELILRSRKSGDAAKQTTGDLKNLKKVGIATFAALGAAALTAKKAFDFGEEGAQLLRLEATGETLADSFGQSMDDIIDSIQTASHQTISRSDAILVANRALRLGVAKTPAEFDKLTKSSIALGRAMGLGPLQSINDLTTGIGRMSPLILDNLGILTAGGKIFDNYARKMGTTADKLTDAEKKQILFNQTIQDAQPLLTDTGELVEDLATKYEQFNKNLDELQDSLTILIARTFPKFADRIMNGTGAINESIRTMEEHNLTAGLFGGFYDEAGRKIAKNYAELREWAAIAEAIRFEKELHIVVHKEIASAEQEEIEAGKELAGENEEIKRSYYRARDAATSFFDKVDTGLGSVLERRMEDLELLAAGGGELMGAEQAITAALEAGKITAPEAEAMYAEVYTQWQNLQIDMNNLDLWQASENISDALDIPIEDAKTKLLEMDGQTLTTELIINMRVGTGSQYRHFLFEDGIGGQYGLDMIVPPGYPNDTFPILASSGEHVKITPQGETNNYNQPFKGMTVNINNTLDMRTFKSMLERLV